ncbi:RING finger and SPRY domain-containing protein 1 [Fragariocoptes setiger]|uniref:RING finger and SPRY domain-containing protein 1 n=1 Tax=Fragariocoptes setiger TaxID=1670756 RepID=A0ABQ7S7A3_9ACAR|nr:RING finger and SPRY domain-containing protein 1 [Fragariocoptes setiger]
MGACLCKSKKRSLERSSGSTLDNNHHHHHHNYRHRHRNSDDSHQTIDGSPTSSSSSSSSLRSGRRLLQSISSLASSSTPPSIAKSSTTSSSSSSASANALPWYVQHKLAVQVDKLVLDFLCSIRTLFEADQEHPTAMYKLHTISETEIGWYVVINSLVNRIDIDHPLGPALILLVLEDAPLPMYNSLAKLENVLKLTSSNDKTQNLARQRNICLVLSCLAEKLAGNLSRALFSDRIQTFLLQRIDPSYSPIVILFALIALEKFAQTIDNKQLIIKRLSQSGDNKHMLELETWIHHSTDYLKKQVGFCAQWGLDNWFIYPDRPYTYETIDTSNINSMLNSKDVSEYLKISADGLMARNDTSFFESVRCTFPISEGIFYYEVKLITAGVMQLGFATKASRFLNHEGFGIGDDDQSLAFDGCRQLLWHNAQSIPVKLPRWKPGDIVGCLIDLTKREVTFSLNGATVPPCIELFKDKADNIEYYAAASFMSFQQCEFNFGSKAFEYPPDNVCFSSFNEKGLLSPADKIIMPRHLSLIKIESECDTFNVCSICCDERATVTLEPCNHDGFCHTCANLLKDCPFCREAIRSKCDESAATTANITSPSIKV